MNNKPTWLDCEDLPDPPRPNVPVERMQEEEMKRLIGWELNLWLMWRGYATKAAP